MKSDEIYRQKPIDKQNYGFSQKLILYIFKHTGNLGRDCAQRDRTDNMASDYFWYNHYH